MPRRDGTGPMGRGPMTGRGMGFCIKEVKEGIFTAGFGSGRGCRGGFRRCFGGNFVPEDISPKTQKEWLLKEKDLLQNRLEAIDRQMESL